MRHVDVAERRARLARRHRLHPDHRAGDVVEAAGGVVCLHGTDPTTVHLSAWARVDGLVVADVARALYEDRTLVRHMAMRRTVHVLPRAGLADAQAGASARVAEAERRRLVKEVEAAGLHADGAAWLADACAQVVELLADGRQATSTELRAALPVLEGSTSSGADRPWGAAFPLAPRVLTVLSAQGRIVRAGNDGRWSTSRPRWASMASWLGHELEPPPPDVGLAGLVRAWLRAFGPGTTEDLRWWLGSTLTGVRRALADLGAVPASVDGGGADAWLLPDDVEPVAPVEPWGALLPSLDPTAMGWAERGWYLGGHKAQVFDRNGNAGPTVWWDGRIVGGWRQDAEGRVELQLLEDPGVPARRALERRAAELTAWFDGARPLPRYPSPLHRAGPATGAPEAAT